MVQFFASQCSCAVVVLCSWLGANFSDNNLVPDYIPLVKTHYLLHYCDTTT